MQHKEKREKQKIWVKICIKWTDQNAPLHIMSTTSGAKYNLKTYSLMSQMNHIFIHN